MCNAPFSRAQNKKHIIFFSKAGNFMWAEPQYLDHLRREILIFSQKTSGHIIYSLLVPLKGVFTFKRGPFQGILKFSNIFGKIHQKCKLALIPSFLGRILSVIPIRKAIDCTVAGGYCKKTLEDRPMRNELLKIQVFGSITQLLHQYQKFLPQT